MSDSWPAKSPEARLRSILPYARAIARGIARRVPAALTDDIFAGAALGAWQAVLACRDATREELLAYARRRIRGGAIDSLRHSDWMPRHLRHRDADLAQVAIDELTQAQVHDALSGAPTQEDDAQLAIDREALYEALARLKPRHRFVLLETYGRERLLQDVAAELGITEARVSQIRTLAIERLQETMLARR